MLVIKKILIEGNVSMGSMVEDNNQFYVLGPLNFNTAMSLWDNSLKLFEQKTELVINLSKSTELNSGALALLLEWMRYAKLSNKKITFLEIPEQLNAIATVAGVQKILF